ncbi:ankyrin repeat domain-containing protein [Comamonas endophytica]|uniref:ankyrin repeat domain-containing protein n=1 Tax=Comamonas endophytica TaxID=2949090 RepID=UPI003623D532
MEAVDGAGDAAIAYAAKNAKVGVVQELVKLGADINACMSAAIDEGSDAAAQTLLQAGACAGAVRAGETFLMSAARQGRDAIVKMLLNAGADRDAAVNGLTALLMAAGRGHAGVVRVLLQAGANIDAVDGEGHSALIVAMNAGHVGVTDLLAEAAYARQPPIPQGPASAAAAAVPAAARPGAAEQRAAPAWLPMHFGADPRVGAGTSTMPMADQAPASLDDWNESLPPIGNFDEYAWNHHEQGHARVQRPDSDARYPA